MPQEKITTAPQWFLDRDYTYIKTLDHMGWYHALMTRSIYDPEFKHVWIRNGGEEKIVLKMWVPGNGRNGVESDAWHSTAS